MNVSPATSPSDAAAAQKTAASRITNALLFHELLKPLTAALGPIGDAVADRFADGLMPRPK